MITLIITMSSIISSSSIISFINILKVLPANEHTPAFSPTTITNTINENSPVGTVIANPVATDADDGPDDIAIYTINQGLKKTYLSFLVSISYNSGTYMLSYTCNVYYVTCKSAISVT